MAFKELVENAVDSTRGISEASISIHIDKLEDCLEITCCDNGSGFDAESVDAVHVIFQSGKLLNKPSHTTGKFGVGLKALAILSHKECCGRELSVQTRIAGLGTCVSFKVGCDEQGTVCIKNTELISNIREDESPRTTVVSYVPHPPDFNHFQSIVSSYLSELAIGMSRPARFILSFEDEDPTVYASNAKIEKSVSNVDPSGLISCSITVEQSADEKLVPPQIHIIRYVNEVPLISNSGSNCMLLGGVVSGLKKIAPSMGIDTGFQVGNSQTCPVSFNVPITTNPVGSTWKFLTIRISLSCPAIDVDYGTLSKSSVVGIKTVSASVSTLVSRCVISTCKRLVKKFPSQFQSVEDYEYKKARNQYIPVIAGNLAALIQRLRLETRERIDSVISNEDGRTMDYKSVIESELVDLLGPPRRGSFVYNLLSES
jgi:DNA topoisomerase VI subunit B